MDNNFSTEQLVELTNIARMIVKGENLENQLWSDAWAGKYPVEPIDSDIQNELKILTAKVIRLQSGNADLNKEYQVEKDRVRIIHLESCEWISF